MNLPFFDVKKYIQNMNNEKALKIYNIIIIRFGIKCMNFFYQHSHIHNMFMKIYNILKKLNVHVDKRLVES